MMLTICSFVVGVICCILYNKITSYFVIKSKYILPYLDILKCVEGNKLVFIKRLNDIVYFKGYEELEIIYNITNDTISAFNDSECVLVPIKSVSNINTDIINEIELKYYKQIYVDISVHNGIIYSNNIIPKDYTKKPQNTVRNNLTSKPNVEFILEDDYNYDDELRLDSILTKIKKYGINSLTKKEHDFIKNIENW